MTDDQSKAVTKQPTSQQTTQSTTQPNSQSTGTPETKAQNPTANNVNPPSQPQVKKIDVAIAGVTYPINCPVHEQEELLSAVSYINDYALDLKKSAPSLSQESILVLCCLNLYEKIHANRKNEEDRQQQSKQSEALLNKIIKDAHAIL